MSIPRAGDASAVWRPRGLARGLALVVSDALALLVSGLAACYLTTGLPLAEWHVTFAPLAALVPLFTLTYGMGGLYPGFDVGAIQLIRTTSRQTSLVFLVIAGSAYALPLAGDYPRATFAVWWAASILAVPLARKQVSSLAGSRSWWREPVLLFGCASTLRTTIDSLARARHLGYRPVAAVLVPPVEDPLSSTWQGLPIVHESDAVTFARRLNVHTALLASDAPASQRWAAELREHFHRVILVHSLEDRFVGPAAIRYLGSAVGIEFQNRLLMRRHRIVKRAMDIVLSVVGLVLLLPVLAAAAVAIMLCNPGPWWHAQTRHGRCGKPFRIWKLRTMYLDASDRLSVHLATDGAARQEWQKEFKLRRDPRVLPVVGRFLRRWSLDECPQFWNVIRGDMSLVGPRALPPYHLDAFGPEFRAIRERMRPGMTGMWQVMSRGRGAIRTQEALDRYYIDNWSLWMDVFVLAKTILTVPSGRGAR